MKGIGSVDRSLMVDRLQKYQPPRQSSPLELNQNQQNQKIFNQQQERAVNKAGEQFAIGSQIDIRA